MGRDASSLFDGGPNGNPDALPWAATRAMLAAQNRTTEAFELYLLAYHLDETNGKTEEVRDALKQAIEHHNRTIDDLEAALETVAGSSAD